MEKEEILQKAQKENKGKDLADLEASRKGTLFGYTIGGILAVALCVIDFVFTKRFPYGPMAGLVSMVFIAFLVKYITLRKKHELFVTICYGCWVIFFLGMWILQLLKVMQYG